MQSKITRRYFYSPKQNLEIYLKYEIRQKRSLDIISKSTNLYSFFGKIFGKIQTKEHLTLLSH